MTETIEYCKQGQAAAQRRLFLHYAPLMMSVCRRYAHDYGEAEDILQEAFIRVFQSIDQFDEKKGSFEGWMRRIVVTTAIRYWHKWHKNWPMTNDACLLEQTEPVTIDERLLEEDILNLIATLPAGFRVVFNLYVIEGFSHAEIAETLHITESASRSQLSRARQQLQRAISEQINYATDGRF
jgi:RNA polymerase sigma factor (sigma-70 family)